MERTKKRLWMYLIKLFCSALKSFDKLTTTRVCAVLCSFVCAEAVTSVTRLGDFWKLLAPNLITKVAQKDRWLFGLFCKRSLYVKLLWLQFGQLLEAFGLLCNSNIWSHCSSEADKTGCKKTTFDKNDSQQQKCDQKKSQNVYKKLPKMISLEKW